MEIKELSKVYEPHDVEDKWIKNWLDRDVFGADPNHKGKPFSIVIPPPNVTGSLHIGHALNNTIQDILVRYHRMIGDNVLWRIGVDHAGIATQSVVERQMAQENLTRHDLGREKFIERVWKWKHESGGTIINQLKRLGASCDYKNERFTMDEGLSQAVLKVFVSLYKEGLIFKDKRLVNWDPKLHTAISDLEVQQKEVKGNFWHLRYPLEDDPSRVIIVATTRPETMLGDTAVAVNPEDERYKDIIGKNVVLPIVGRKIPIVADEHADPEHGTGAVKITPAHDFNDFEVGKRHNLEMINVLDTNACINENAPEKYQGLDRYQARDEIVKDLEACGALEEIEEIKHMVPYGDRSGVVVEPYLTDQWFVDAKTLAKPALEAVETGKTRFVPQFWQNTYFEWLRNIQPWCISRQIWWGHQIPAWYGPDGKYFVEETVEEALAAAKEHYGKEVELTRETDVLDTWFSSALWPFSTMGWPEETAELKTFYPTTTLVTAFDIIFFWVARMMMMGIHFMKEVPFKDVHIHAIVRDPMGQKMSKSKGNVVDPLHMMTKYGTDAMRFTLASFAAQGRDIKLDEARIEGYRNFCNKIWNASRFVLMTAAPFVENEESFSTVSPQNRINQWLLVELSNATQKVRDGIESYDFNKAALACYTFFWNVFCDRYVELTKEIYKEGTDELKKETAETTFYVLNESLKLLHPFMPFITEEIWQILADRGEKSIARETFPEVIAYGSQFEQSWKEVSLLNRSISTVRSIRQETGVALNEPVAIEILAQAEDKKLYQEIESLMTSQGKVSQITYIDEFPKTPSAVAKSEDILIAIPLQGLIDQEKEMDRQSRKIKKVEKDIQQLNGQLGNPKFTQRAPQELIDEKKTLLVSAQEQLELLKQALEVLK